MELLTNTLVTQDDFESGGELPVLNGGQRCPSGWYELVIAMDPLSVSDGSYVYLERDDDRESIPMMSRRSMLVFSPRSFQLTFRPPRPETGSSYTIYSLNLLPVDRQDLAFQFETCVFGDRKKISILMQLECDEDRWKALKDFIADDVFDCAELGLQIEHPTDLTWEGGGFFTSHSYRSYFLVGRSDTPTMSRLIRCKIEGGSVSSLLLPKLYFSGEDGTFSEKTGIRFPAMIEHMVAERIIHLPRNARVRVNPVSSPGIAQIASIRFERSTISDLVTKTAASFFTGGYREIPGIVRELPLFRKVDESGTARRGLISKFWLLYRRLNRALSSRELPATSKNQDLKAWLEDFQPSPAVLESYRASVTRLRLNTQFSLVCTLNQVDKRQLKRLVQSMLDQVYINWELILIADNPGDSQDLLFSTDGNTDSRIHYVPHDPAYNVSQSLNAAVKQASGDYLIFVDPAGILEKHALYKFAAAVRSEAPDFLYSDEVIAGEDIDNVADVTTRPAFSIDYYLSHPYFKHLVCVRHEIARKAGVFDESLDEGEIVDFNLRCLEKAKVITHVPDYLYRSHSRDVGDTSTADNRSSTLSIEVIQHHLSRTGRDATARRTQHSKVFDVRERIPKDARVAAIIPTKNNQQLLQKAVDSCVQKSGQIDVDIFIIDHESDDDATKRYLAHLESESLATVIPYEGPFNFSTINNMAVATLPSEITHYLFLNNDVEAKSDGWIEAMTATCSRRDVGACGAMLLYPDDSIQHGGVAIGMLGAAEHSYKSEPYFDSAGLPTLAHNCALVSRRDGMAVTAAVMMVRADVFHESGGYDEELQVGFNDTDLCIRIFQNGYKVIFDSNVVLYHFESATRPTGASDPHPEDTQRFRDRHRNWIEKKDPFYGAQLSLATTARVFDTDLRSQFAKPRTIIQPNGCYGKRWVKM